MQTRSSSSHYTNRTADSNRIAGRSSRSLASSNPYPTEGHDTTPGSSSSYSPLRYYDPLPSPTRSVDSQYTTPSDSSSSHPLAERSERKALRRSSTSNTLLINLKAGTITSRSPNNIREPLKSTAKSPYLKAASKKAHDHRHRRVQALKERALKIESTGKAPATERQRLVMMMVFEEITPYPDDGWLSQVAVVINREYKQVKNWFSNQRQKDSRANRENATDAISDYSSPPPGHLSALRKVECEGRTLRLRPHALEHFPKETWSDQFFEEILMIQNVRLMFRLRNRRGEVMAPP